MADEGAVEADAVLLYHDTEDAAVFNVKQLVTRLKTGFDHRGDRWADLLGRVDVHQDGRIVALRTPEYVQRLSGQMDQDPSLFAVAAN